MSTNLGTSNPVDLEKVIAKARAERWRRLSLNRQRVDDAGARAIATLTDLTELDLSHNLIGAEGARALATLPNLSGLQLDWNHIGDEGALTLSTLKGLTSLELVGNHISLEGAQALVALENLSSLDLSLNVLGDLGVQALVKLPHLKSLRLGGCGIGNAGASALATRRTLTHLSLSKNAINADGVRALSALVHLTWLDLEHNEIEDKGALALASLTSVVNLNLARNRIGAVSCRALASLEKLRHLNLDFNNIGDEGALALARAMNLESLHLWSNGITQKGAHALASLTELGHLDVEDNAIGDEGALALASLPRLKWLYLRKTEIGNDGARALRSLTNLKSLWIAQNPIGDAGIRALLDSWIANGSKIINVRLPQIAGSSLPPEILAMEDAQALLAAYRRYGFSTSSQTLNEAKLLIVGNEAVGKTSLVRYLVDGRPRDPDERKTPGIATRHRIETHRWSPAAQGPTLNVWDFGGQEIMHGTHKFFLTERSLYLLVLEDRREDDDSVYDWLRIIANRGGTSPVIVVINKCDEGRQHLFLNETRLAREFPTIAGSVMRTSCIEGAHARRTIEELRLRIVETLNNDPRLAHVRDPLPISWLRVKDAVAVRASLDKILRVSDFEALCATAPPQDEPISDPAEIRALLHLLHDLGTIVAHGLRQDAPAALREITLLDPNWLTQAIYTLLNSEKIKRQEGEFSRQDMSSILDPALYPPDRHEFILEMMEHPDVGLCFEILGSQRRRFLIPELLSANEPADTLSQWPADSLCFRHEYVFLPRSFIPRFIVFAHQMLATGPTRWREGAVIAAANCRVLLVADRARKVIDIKVEGPVALRRSALNVALAELDRVHAINPEMSHTALVPLPDRPVVHVPYDHLLKLEQRFGPEYRYFPDGADREYTLAELLAGVGTDLEATRRRERRDPVAPAPALAPSPAPEAPALAPAPAPGAAPVPDPTSEALQLLKRRYTGPWGAKVFWLAAFTLLPVFVQFKWYSLEFSLASIVYLFYHVVAFFTWMDVRALTKYPENFSPAERVECITTQVRRDAIAHRLSFVVLALLGLTFVAKATIVYGTSKIQVPLPEVVYNVLGVPLTSENAEPVDLAGAAESR